jgi:hypothetical protein
MYLVSLMYNGPRSKTAKRQQWQAFRLLGANGVTIPSEVNDEPDQDTPGAAADEIGESRRTEPTGLADPPKPQRT